MFYYHYSRKGEITTTNYLLNPNEERVKSSYLIINCNDRDFCQELGQEKVKDFLNQLFKRKA